MHRRSLPTSLVLFHCRFGADGLRDHLQHRHPLPSYQALPHLYAICAIDERAVPERMVSGLLVKTNVRFGDPVFLDAMSAAYQAVPQLQHGLHAQISLLPAPVLAASPSPLSEDQALTVFKELWSEHLAKQVMARFR